MSQTNNKNQKCPNCQARIKTKNDYYVDAHDELRHCRYCDAVLPRLYTCHWCGRPVRKGKLTKCSCHNKSTCSDCVVPHNQYSVRWTMERVLQIL